MPGAADGGPAPHRPGAGPRSTRSTPARPLAEAAQVIYLDLRGPGGATRAAGTGTSTGVEDLARSATHSSSSVRPCSGQGSGRRSGCCRRLPPERVERLVLVSAAARHIHPFDRRLRPYRRPGGGRGGRAPLRRPDRGELRRVLRVCVPPTPATRHPRRGRQDRDEPGARRPLGGTAALYDVREEAAPYVLRRSCSPQTTTGDDRRGTDEPRRALPTGPSGTSATRRRATGSFPTAQEGVDLVSRVPPPPEPAVGGSPGPRATRRRARCTRRSHAARRRGRASLAVDALELRRQRGQRRPGALVARVGLQLDAQAAEPLERVLEHQQLRLDVDAGAPRVGREPRPADLDAPVLRPESQEAGAAHHTIVLAPHRHEGHLEPAAAFASASPR